MAHALCVCPCGAELSHKQVQVGVWLTIKRKCSNCRVRIEVGELQFKCTKDRRILCQNCVPSAAIKDAPPPPVPPSDSGSSGGAQVFEPDVMLVRENAQDCRYGVSCWNFDIEHRTRFKHPPGRTGLQMCKKGHECKLTDKEHLMRFAHPGDRNFRNGLVRFGRKQKPEFRTMWEIFEFFDPDESGHLSKQEFEDLCSGVGSLSGLDHLPDLEKQTAWKRSGGADVGHVNFQMFVSWMKEEMGLYNVPLGVDQSRVNARACRIIHRGRRCECTGYTPSDTYGVCECGHKISAHRTSVCHQTLGQMLQAYPDHWDDTQEGLALITDPGLLQRLQAIMDVSIKPPPDNWTRDRGCHIHGVNGCAFACSSRNKMAVPTGYRLMLAYRNQNLELWRSYCLARAGIGGECRRYYKEDPFREVSCVTSGHELDSPIDASINEWYLFHGSSPEGCKSICKSNFRVSMAGSGATWKDAGKDVGTPLYGFGIYLAERITKSDEYSSQMVPRVEEQTQEPYIPPNGSQVHCMLLCRCLGGRANVCTTNEIDVDNLKTEVFEGPYNSVFGDREKVLKKPYREVVVYDKDQCYPEFLLVYQRIFS